MLEYCKKILWRFSVYLGIMRSCLKIIVSGHLILGYLKNNYNNSYAPWGPSNIWDHGHIILTPSETLHYFAVLRSGGGFQFVNEKRNFKVQLLNSKKEIPSYPYRNDILTSWIMINIVNLIDSTDTRSMCRRYLMKMINPHIISFLRKKSLNHNLAWINIWLLLSFSAAVLAYFWITYQYFL